MAIFKRRALETDDHAVKSSDHMTLKQSLLPNLLVTILFFLWGFAYGLLDVLNSHFQTGLNITASEASGLSASYFGAYFVYPLTISGWILRRYGFRVTFKTGLAVLAVGCLLFWPSGVKRSFGGFCCSMFIVGAGLSTLESGADNFLAICGPPRYSKIRLNLAQGVQGIGSFAAPLLALRVFFADANDESSLNNVQWAYLGVAGFVALLIILFFFAPMPEVTDADMEAQEQEIADHERKPFWKQHNLFFGVWGQFCYVGAQVAVANYFMSFCQEAGYSSAPSSYLLAVGQGVYTAMRFIGSGLMTIRFFKPRYMLTAFLTLCFISGIASVKTTGATSVAMLILVLAFESICFATNFTLGLRGLGRHTKRGGSCLVAAISGGAAIPPICGAVATRTGSFHTAMAVPAAFYVAALVFPFYVNFFNAENADSHRDSSLNIQQTDEDGEKGLDKEFELEGKGPVERVERA